MSKKRKIQYGVQQYAMINSGTHQMSVFPMSGPLSIYGRNNLGKTQSLQSMQFLFFNNLTHMNFGSFDGKTSRAFFFPAENSFLLMEIMLPAGIFLLGAHGKGASHGNEYELFVCKKELDTTDFIENGCLIGHRKVFSRWAEQGHDVMMLTKDELRQMLYGEFSKVKNGRWDLTLFPLANANEKRYNTFRHIYRNLLTQAELKSRELKDLLLNVFNDKLSNAMVNFTEVRQSAFREHNVMHNDIQKLEMRREDIESFYNEHQNYLEYMTSAGLLKRQLSVNLALAVEAYPTLLTQFKNTETLLNEERHELDFKRNVSTEDFARYTSEHNAYVTMQKEIASLQAKCGLGLRSDIENSLRKLTQEMTNLKDELGRSDSLNPKLLERRIKEKKQSIKSLEARLNPKAKVDTIADALTLSDKTMRELSRVLHPSVLSLPQSALVESKAGALSQHLYNYLSPTDAILINDGFTLDLSDIEPQGDLTEDPQVLAQELAMVQEELARLEESERIALDQQAARERLSGLEQEVNSYQRYLSDADRLTSLQEQFEEDAQKRAAIFESLTQSKVILDEFQALFDKNSSAMGECLESIKKINDKRKELANFQRSHHLSSDYFPMARGDDDDFVINLEEADFREMIDQMNKYENATSNIQMKNKACMQRIIADLPGLSEYADWSEFSMHAKERVDNLENNREMLHRLHEEAVIRVASTLSDLSSNYRILENEVAQFNRNINSKKISNLKRFSIDINKNAQVLEAIDVLLGYMAQHEFQPGDMFSTHVSEAESISGGDLRRAMDRLTKVVEEGRNGNLELADLFEVSFSSIDAQGKESVVDKLDQLGSTGTKMTMKPLLYMCLMRHLMDRKATSNIYLPFYLDEAAGVDPTNQATIIDYSHDMGFTPVFSSVQPATTARYAVNIAECVVDNERIYITPEDWQHFEPIDLTVDDQPELTLTH